MKRIHLALVLLTALFAAGFISRANASAAGTFEMSLGYSQSSTELGRQSNPELSTGESFDGGLGVGGAFWRRVSPTVSWGAEVSYDNLGEVKAQYTTSGTDVVETFSAKVVRATPSLRLNFGKNAVGPNFFAQAGAGVYNVAWKHEYSDDSSGPPSNFTREDSSSELGLNFGAGVTFPMGPKTRMNLSGIYHFVPKPDTATNFDDLNNYQLRVGLAFVM